ncbi:MAG: IMS domain-containing protein, partial [Microcystaceae cyanobacterium]
VLNRELEDPNLSQTNRADIILTLALAYLELSREQWQQREYENAAVSGQKGLDVLLAENLFLSIQEEICTDLYKLRPYRILELLALSENEVVQRRKGKQLLREMLQERQGIDGKGNDRSGLSIDDFLRFIQQLRIYLTVAEQQELFEAEAQRPSAVATYLTVYALIARGFAQRQPHLIVQADEILRRLSKRQDVNLEQAVCALLLGQTGSASSALELSHDSETLAFIREQSQGAPDLLPGLCLYGERWLQSEVFSHFRDLVDRDASLENYFANEEVQAYLEQLSVAMEAENQAITEVTEEAAVKMARATTESQNVYPERARETRRKSLLARSRSAKNQVLAEATTGSAITVTAPSAESYTRSKVSPSRGYESEPSSDDQLVVTTAYSQPTLKSPQRRKRSTDVRRSRQSRQSVDNRMDKPGLKSKRSLKTRRWLLGIMVLLGLGAVGFLIKGLLSAHSSVPGLEGEQLSISLQQPPVEIPSLDAQVILPQGNLTQEGAHQVIQAWLSSKSQAFGSNHKVDQLNTILDKPLLSQWYGRAQKLKG